ncbi:12S rRNA N(4)-cytidine methyltransferase METTL15 [Salvelinus sp. IW2-2015]|uniref:12S rRNA N(4)-cytidine methyltransferase METTL15 n=1 Tax=Salvelinus sp. IW2-2015 TaxID=2691554 RepID=UPI0038D388F0
MRVRVNFLAGAMKTAEFGPRPDDDKDDYGPVGMERALRTTRLGTRPVTCFALQTSLKIQYSFLPPSPSGRVHPLLGRFSELGALLSRLRLQSGSVDAVLLDAGCSSMQMDCPERGFSLSKDGPLDMRMDAERYPDMPCAADVVNALDQQALASILTAYGEERHARKIASAMVEARSVYPITRTQQLASVVAGSLPASALYARKDRLQRPSHVATKTFQALRMFVNDELNELHAGLCTAQTMLKPGGRLCVLTFHSLEDRLVKRFLHGEDVGAPPRRSLRQRVQRWEEEEEEEKDGEKDSGHWVDLQRGVLMPQAEDVLENPRGRSAKLRAAFKQ